MHTNRWLVLAAALVLVTSARDALATPLPSIDQPIKTGEKTPHDAAVVIGIEDYFVLPDVPYAQRDARAFYDFLLYTRGVPSANLRLLDAGASREKILEAIEDASSQADAKGTVWIYFAGHGAASPTTSERMLLGVDAQPEMASFEARAIPLSELQSLASAGGASVMMVMDTCYAGKGRAGGDLIEGKRFAVPASVLSSSEDGLAEWTAASANELSGPLDSVQHGAFTYFALGALRGWADGQLDDVRDGVVTAEEAQLYVEEALRSVQVVDQSPQLSAGDASALILSSGGGNFEEPPVLSAALVASPEVAAPEASVSDVEESTAVDRSGYSLSEKIIGLWAVQMTESEKREVEAASRITRWPRRGRVGSAEDPVTMAFTTDQMTFTVMGQIMSAFYVYEEVDGSLIVSASSGGDKILTATFRDDDTMVVQMEGEPQEVVWVRK